MRTPRLTGRAHPAAQNIATDRSNGTMFGQYSGGRVFVDSLFAFNAQLGQDYSGSWHAPTVTLTPPETLYLIPDL